jgi:N-acetylmuramate 1-kinase
MNSHERIMHFAQEALRLSKADRAELIPFTGRGSDRTYFRLKWGAGNSVIIVHYELSRRENAYYAEIALFLRSIDVPVPEIIHHDSAGCLIVMKDLGDTDLWSLRNEPWERRRNLYQKTLSIVHRLHCYPAEGFPVDQVRLTEAFGPDLYRWEQSYFLENFVSGFSRLELDPGFLQELEKELSDLAGRLVSTGQSLVHRDLQSQNVMIEEDRPYLIDFQGMRFGSCFYDLGSLLCDPYVNLSDGEREELLAYYYCLSKNALDWSSFQNIFWEASAQRLMQALGAYGYLGLVKGLRNYLAHIPAGLRNLRNAAQNASSLALLLELSAECERMIPTSLKSFEDLKS